MSQFSSSLFSGRGAPATHRKVGRLTKDIANELGKKRYAPQALSASPRIASPTSLEGFE
jgi:hypothetical protein